MDATIHSGLRVGNFRNWPNDDISATSQDAWF